MRQHSINAGHGPQKRRFRSLKGFLSPDARDDPDAIDPQRIVAFLEQSGGTATRAAIAANLGVSPGAVDDAATKLESIGAVSASPTEDASDITLQLTESKPPEPPQHSA